MSVTARLAVRFGALGAAVMHIIGTVGVALVFAGAFPGRHGLSVGIVRGLADAGNVFADLTEGNSGIADDIRIVLARMSARPDMACADLAGGRVFRRIRRCACRSRVDDIAVVLGEEGILAKLVIAELGDFPLDVPFRSDAHGGIGSRGQVCITFHDLWETRIAFTGAPCHLVEDIVKARSLSDVANGFLRDDIDLLLAEGLFRIHDSAIAFPVIV